jgi:hypothetical protein
MRKLLARSYFMVPKLSNGIPKGVDSGTTLYEWIIREFVRAAKHEGFGYLLQSNK